VAERWVTPTVRFAWKRGAKTVLTASKAAVYRQLARSRIDAIINSAYEPAEYENGYCVSPGGSHRCPGPTRKAVIVERLAALYQAFDARRPLPAAAAFDLSHFTADQLDALQVAIDWHRTHGKHKPAKRSRKPKP
jgi:hypothetical protein